jgi:hypothetical protein
LGNFQNIVTEELSSSELRTQINENEDFTYDHPFSNAGLDDLSGNCLTNLFEANSTVNETSTGVYEIFMPSTDVKSCFSDPEITVQSYPLSLLVQASVVNDLNQPISGLEGDDALSAVLEEPNGYNLSLMKRQIHGVANIQVTVYGETISGTVIMKEMISATGAETSCSADILASSIKGCDIRELYQIRISGGGVTLNENNISILSLKNLNYLDGASYYSDGTIDFRINNWTGTRNYTANPSLAPTWTAVNQNSHPATGTFSYSP